MYEMPIACPMPSIHVTDLQIAQRQFLPRKIFDNMVSRYKTALAQIFKCGAWKNRSHEDILVNEGLAVTTLQDITKIVLVHRIRKSSL